MTRCENCKWMHGNNPRYEYFRDDDCSHPMNVRFRGEGPNVKFIQLVPIADAEAYNQGNCRYYAPTLLGRVKGWLGL